MKSGLIINLSQEVLQDKYDLLKQIEAKLEIAGKGTQQLLTSKKIVEDYSKRIKAQKEKDEMLGYKIVKGVKVKKI